MKISSNNNLFKVYGPKNSNPAKQGAPSEASKAQSSVSDEVTLSPKGEVESPAEVAVKQQLEGKEWQEGELLLKLGAAPKGLQNVVSPLDRLNLNIKREFDFGDVFKTKGERFLHVELPAGVSVEEALVQLHEDPMVQIAEPNFSTKFEPESASSSFVNSDGENLEARQWNHDNTGQTGGVVDADIDAPEAWSAHGVGRGVQDEGAELIAINDTGVDVNHPDLKNNIFVNHGEIPNNGIDDDKNGYIDDYTGWNAALENGDVSDGHGHGTHCAGIAGADGTNDFGVSGVNKKAKILPVKIMGSGRLDVATIARALQYSKDMGVRVTSNSWRFPYSDFVKEAFENNPAIHAFSAGNTADNNDTFDHYPSDYVNPNKSAVASTNDKDQKSSFSNYGSETVEVGAPGEDILSTLPGNRYGKMSGTSMAAPHIAGAALLIANTYPGLSNAEILDCIHNYGDTNSDLEGRTVGGNRLNLKAALDRAQEIASGKVEAHIAS